MSKPRQDKKKAREKRVARKKLAEAEKRANDRTVEPQGNEYPTPRLTLSLDLPPAEPISPLAPKLPIHRRGRSF